MLFTIEVCSVQIRELASEPQASIAASSMPMHLETKLAALQVAHMRQR
jgi:hypothetical protein